MGEGKETTRGRWQVAADFGWVVGVAATLIPAFSLKETFA